MTMRAARIIVVALAAAFLLSGCGGWYGTVTFQTRHESTGGHEGGAGSAQTTTYHVDPGSVLATVTSTFDGWVYDWNGMTMPDGCVATYVVLHGSVTAHGYLDVVTGHVIVGLIPTTAPSTFPLAVTSTFNGHDDGSECGAYAAGTTQWSATTDTSQVDLTAIGDGTTADGGYVTHTDTCYNSEFGQFDSCLVVVDVHPQPSVK